MKNIFVICVIFISALRLTAQTNGQIRLAVVSEKEETLAVADVLTAELSGHKNLQLLERNEINRVYHEQGLSLGNEDYMKLGQILGADGLLLLETSTEGANQFLFVRLVAVKPGVVLIAEKFPWPMTNITEWSPAFANHLDLFLPKLMVLVKDAIPISVVNLRSAISSADARETERQLKLLTIQRLSHEKQLFVLERQKMQLLSEEKELKLDDSEFWSGSYLLEGTIDRDGYSPEKMTISMQLTPPRGGAVQQIELSVSRTNLNGAVNELAEKVIETLKLKQGSTPWNAADEAEQFFFEAKWAYRWGLLSQAQAATESAWALGLRTKEVAALRVRAYADGVWPINPWIGNIEIPAVPNAAKLPAIIRALDLFCHDAPLFFTNSISLDEKWYLDGIHIFRESAAMLDGFYMAAELRRGNEDQLAEVRLLTRQTLLLLETKAPALLKGLPLNVGPHGRSFSREDYKDQGLQMYDLVKWDEGGVLFERPEDALPVFRQMIEEGYTPTELPRIIGWTWEDRKRVPQVSRDFITELCATTNPATKLGGLSLALMQTPFYPQENFHACEQELMTAMWEYRDWIFSRDDHASILLRTEKILRDKYGDIYGNNYFDAEPFAILRYRLRKDYLTAWTNFDSQVFDQLFPLSPARGGVESVDEARELIPMMETLSSKNWRVSQTIAQLLSIASLLPPSSPAPISAKHVMPAEQPLVTEFIDWNLNRSSFESGLVPKIQRVIVRDNRLWSQVCYLLPGQPFPFNSPTIYVATDPQTGSSTQIPFPENLGYPDAGFEVTKDSLYVSVQNHLLRYRLQEKTWEAIPVPMDNGAQITELDGQLYLFTGDSLLKIAPDSHVVQILASARRQPPANEIDPLLNSSSPELFRVSEKPGLFRVNEQLGLSIGTNIFAFAPANQKWQRLSALPTRGPLESDKYFSDAGVEVQFWGFSSRPRLVGIWLDSTKPELLLNQHIPREQTNAVLDQLLGAPTWDWPDPYQLDAAAICAEGKSLWLLHPLKFQSFFGGWEQPVTFQDDRLATLLRFERGSRQSLSVPIRFEKDGQPTDPFDYKNLPVTKPESTAMPLWLVTPQGLVVIAGNLSGHWFISKAELEKRFEIQRAARKKQLMQTPTKE
jgi:hypothetical protein